MNKRSWEAEGDGVAGRDEIWGESVKRERGSGVTMETEVF